MAGRLYARSRRLSRERRLQRGARPGEPSQGWQDPWAPRTTRGQAIAGRGHVGSDDLRDVEHFGMGMGIRTTRPGSS